MSNNYCGVWHGKGNELAAFQKDDEATCLKSRCDKVCMKLVVAQKCGCPELFVVELHYRKPERTTETITMYKIDGVLQGAHASGRGVVSLKLNRDYVTLRYSVAQPNSDYFMNNEDWDEVDTAVSLSGSVSLKRYVPRCEPCVQEEPSCDTATACECN